MGTVQIALVQMDTSIGQVENNLLKVLTYMQQAKHAGAELVVFPELILTGYNLEILGDAVPMLARKTDGALREIQSLAKELAVGVVCGLSMERGIPGVIYNSAVVINECGEILGHYDKINAFGQERHYYRMGNQFPLFKMENGFQFGVMICYDAGFPEVSRILAMRGSNALICPSAWCSEDAVYWDLTLRARALDNLIPVIGVNRVGMEGSVRFDGGSRVVNSKGKVLHELGLTECCHVVSLNLHEYLDTRREFKHLTDYRLELYQDQFNKMG